MMPSNREHQIQRLWRLHEQTQQSTPLSQTSPWATMQANRRKAVRQVVIEDMPTWGGPEVVTGDERVRLVTWLAEMTGWWTSQEALRALDDLVGGLPLDEVLRICSSEGFIRVGERVDQGDRQLFLLDGDGLLAELFAPHGPAGQQPWSLTIYGNAEVEDRMLFNTVAAAMSQIDNPNGPSLAAGALQWHLRYPTCSNGSLRVTLAALRATSRPLAPWRHPPITGWFGPDTPRGLTTERSHEVIATAGRAATRAALDGLSDHVHAKLGPRLMIA